MKNLYLISHLEPYVDHDNWTPFPTPGENEKDVVQSRFIEEKLPEIKQGQARAVIIGGGGFLLERALGEDIFYKSKKDPTDKEVRELNALIGEEAYQLVPVGPGSKSFIPALVRALLNGGSYCSFYSASQITLTERLNVQGHQVIPELLIPPVEILNLRQ